MRWLDRDLYQQLGDYRLVITLALASKCQHTITLRSMLILNDTIFAVFFNNLID